MFDREVYPDLTVPTGGGTAGCSLRGPESSL